MISDYIVEMAVRMLHTEIRITANKSIVKKYAGLEEGQDPFLTDEKFLQTVWERRSLSIPDIFSEYSTIYYARLDIDSETSMLIGPVCVMGNITEAEQFMRKFFFG